MSIFRIHYLVIFLACFAGLATAQQRIVAEQSKNNFKLAAPGKQIVLYGSDADFPGVIRALHTLQADIKLVTGSLPAVITTQNPTEKEIVIVGTIGKNKWIDQLIENKKLDVSD